MIRVDMMNAASQDAPFTDHQAPLKNTKNGNHSQTSLIHVGRQKNDWEIIERRGLATAATFFPPM
jgi:hypothetical protein